MQPHLSIKTQISAPRPLVSPGWASPGNVSPPPAPHPPTHHQPQHAERARSTSLSDNQGGSAYGSYKPLPPTFRGPGHDEQPAGRGSLDSRRPSEPARRTDPMFEGQQQPSYYAAGGHGGSSYALGSLSPLSPLPGSPRSASHSMRVPPSSNRSLSSNTAQQQQSPLSPLPPMYPPPLVSSSSAASIRSTQPSLARSAATFAPYDAKIVGASFERLPPLPAAPSTQNPHPTPDPSLASSHNPYPHSSHPTSALSTLFLHVLPLFNGSPLLSPLEDLNRFVRTHVQSTVSRSPSRATALLTADLRELIGSGMMTLNARFSNVDDGKLIVRFVDAWVFFWSTVVPYVEGVFLPLGTDPILLSAAGAARNNTGAGGGGGGRGGDAGSRPSFSHRNSNGAGGGNGRPSSPLTPSGVSMSFLHHHHHYQGVRPPDLIPSGSIDVRLHLLTSYLVSVVRPLLPRLLAILADPQAAAPLPSHLARLQQMTLVLLTQSDPDIIGPKRMPPSYSSSSFASSSSKSNKPAAASSSATSSASALPQEVKLREPLLALLQSITRARDGFPPAGSSADGGGQPSTGDGSRTSTSSQKVDRRAGWIAGRHRRQLTLNADPTKELAALDFSIESATPVGKGGILGGVGGGMSTATPRRLSRLNRFAMGDASTTPTQSVVQMGLGTAEAGAGGPMDFSYATSGVSLTPSATPTTTHHPQFTAFRLGRGAHNHSSTTLTASGEDAYLDSFRSPDLRSELSGGSASPGAASLKGDGQGPPRRHSSPVEGWQRAHVG